MQVADLDKTEADRKEWEARVVADRASHQQAMADFEVGIGQTRCPQFLDRVRACICPLPLPLVLSGSN
jgi:hypothetical protein